MARSTARDAATNTTRAHALKAAAVWLALCLLLAATLAGAYLDIGNWKLPLSLGIATLKAALVVVLFMELFSSAAISRLAAAAGLAWLVILFALTFSDEGTRPRAPEGFQRPLPAHGATRSGSTHAESPDRTLRAMAPAPSADCGSPPLIGCLHPASCCARENGS